MMDPDDLLGHVFDEDSLTSDRGGGNGRPPRDQGWETSFQEAIALGALVNQTAFDMNDDGEDDDV